MNYDNVIAFAEKYKTGITKVFPMKTLSQIKTKVLYRQSLKWDYNFVKYNSSDYKNGVNLYGDIDSQTGLGESSRILANVINTANIPCAVRRFHIVAAGEKRDERCLFFEDRLTQKQLLGKQKPIYGINIFDISPSEMPMAYMHLGKSIFDGHYNIGYWVWELKTLPKLWQRSIDMVDEIWTPSEYSSEIFRKYTDKPVITIPHAIMAKPDESSDRAYFFLPEDKFLFLMVYDDKCPEGRKNSIAALTAFRQAAAKCNAHLVVKTDNINESTFLKDENNEKLLKDVRERVHVVYHRLSNTEKNSLINCCDSFISLHRAEGFGLVIAEAMGLGKPVVATGFSGNMDYMNEHNSCMVDFESVVVGKGNFPFSAKDKWAKPDISGASEFMVKLTQDKLFYQAISERAKQTMQDRFNTKTVSDKVRDRIAKVIEENRV